MYLEVVVYSFDELLKKLRLVMETKFYCVSSHRKDGFAVYNIAKWELLVKGTLLKAEHANNRRLLALLIITTFTMELCFVHRMNLS